MSNAFLNDEIKFSHPYYKIMELEGENLKNALSNWSRTELIHWLMWNVKNGVYSDEQSKDEFMFILGKKEAIEIIKRQISGT